MQALIIVGSPIRAAKMAESLDPSATVHEYCHLPSGNTDREYSLFSLSWKDLPYKIGIASHGIGASGIEIVLAELNALISLANNDNQKIPLRAVIRSGTRGTIDDIPLGSLALTSLAFNDNFDSKVPSGELITYLKQSSETLNLNLYEGACLSSQFFWSKQGRSTYPEVLRIAENLELLEENNHKYLLSLKQKNIKYIEMEDFYLNYFAERYGLKSASVGIVVARRYEPKLDKFVLSYDKNAKKENELIPGKLALHALQTYLN